jgi:hypothetical protein
MQPRQARLTAFVATHGVVGCRSLDSGKIYVTDLMRDVRSATFGPFKIEDSTKRIPNGNRPCEDFGEWKLRSAVEFVVGLRVRMDEKDDICGI